MSTIRQGRIAPGDLRSYPQPVIDLICVAINDLGVPFRILDGKHLMLYSGDRSNPPFKVAASRSHQATLRKMIPWLETHTSWRRPGVRVESAVPHPTQSIRITRTRGEKP